MMSPHKAAAGNGPAQISLSAAAEDTNAIVVSGQVKDFAGNNIAEARNLFATVIAPTNAKGAVSVVSQKGTSLVAVTHASDKDSQLTFTTLSDGSFQLSIADDQSEAVVLIVSGDSALPAVLKLTFA